jgi:hypothetical protein
VDFIKRRTGGRDVSSGEGKSGNGRSLDFSGQKRTKRLAGKDFQGLEISQGFSLLTTLCPELQWGADLLIAKN